MDQWCQQRPVVDSHFHIWNLKKFAYPWPTEDCDELYRDFDIKEYEEAARVRGVTHAVFVQVLNGNLKEIEWILEKAKSSQIIQGIVGGVDVTDDEFPSTLRKLKENPLFVGVRHILDFEEDNWLVQPKVQKGLRILEAHNLTFDLLVRPRHLRHAINTVQRFPKLKFIVDHIAKPLIKDGTLIGWREDLAELAQFQNVHVKISGMVTEADLKNWKEDDFVPYVQHVLSCFGPNRCLFGSDWPVCRVAGADHAQVFDLAKSLTAHLTSEDQQNIFGLNAIRVYNLKP